MRSLPRLWLCADLGLRSVDALLAAVDAACAYDAALVWLRAPREIAGAEHLAAARALRSVTTLHGALLLVGDRLDVALAAGADGVHLGEASVSPSEARGMLGSGAVVSRAVHDAAGIASHRDAADALVLAPFLAVPGKGPALGARGFASLRASAPASFVVALGGLATPADVHAAFASGASAVALRRGLDDPALRDAARALP